MCETLHFYQKKPIGNQKISQVVEPKDFQVQNLGVRIFMPNERLQEIGGGNAPDPPGSTWHIGELGQSCSDVCANANGGVCTHEQNIIIPA